MLHYSSTGEAVFRVHLLEKTAGEPHLWVLLGTGSWIPSETRGSWITVHSWVTDGELISRIEDPEDSPFSDADAFDERRLRRDEVFAQTGGPEWVFKCHDLIVEHHPAVKHFLKLQS
jgi:hypothetical protein